MSSNHDDDDSRNTNGDDADSVVAENTQAEDISSILAKSLMCGATEALGYEVTMHFLNWFIEAVKHLM